MSYILDALKKAEAERERGQVPGLNASTPAPRPDDEPFEGHRLPSWAWAALGALMTLVAALVWALTERDPAPAPAPPAVQQAVMPQPAQPMHPAPVATAREPWMPPAPADTVLVPANVARTPAAQSPKLEPPAAKATRNGSDQRIHALNELPDDVRQALPALSFGGAMYSDQPASRMLIINGQAFHEGDRITDELHLREIKLRSAVLVFKGYAYAVNY